MLHVHVHVYSIKLLWFMWRIPICHQAIFKYIFKYSCYSSLFLRAYLTRLFYYLQAGAELERFEPRGTSVVFYFNNVSAPAISVLIIIAYHSYCMYMLADACRQLYISTVLFQSLSVL